MWRVRLALALPPGVWTISVSTMVTDELASLSRRIEIRRDLPSPDVRRALRQAAGISQADVARAAGVTRQAVHLWERGMRVPCGENLDTYAAVLNMFKRAVSDS
jgi:DNA-binding XRE family transcriptional regulator